MEYVSAEITELAKAMLKVQQCLNPAPKDGANPFTKSRYATLNSVMETCRNALLSNDIWLAQYPVPSEPGTLGLVTKLTHAKSGQWQSSLAVAPLPKADPQGYGSCLTYLRRYALVTLLGMVMEDDDAEGAKISDKNEKYSLKAEDGSTVSSFSQAQPRPGCPHLPKIDGITYHTVSAQDGRPCIVAKGDTFAKKSLLEAAGFHWNPRQRLCWKYADVS